MGFERVRRLVRATSTRRERSIHVYECRRCGQSLEDGGDDCRYCETSDVVEYRIG